MKAFTKAAGVAIPFLENDVNTDQIAPVGGGVKLHEDYTETLFKNRRRRDDGSIDESFVFNSPQFRRGAILVTGHNFGCGSSRESAVWVFQAIGVSCIIARSFADIYRENCLQNGVLALALPEADAARLELSVLSANGAPVFSVDLVERTIEGPDGLHIRFEISEAERTRLLEGLDDIGLTLKQLPEIEAWEKRMASEAPWAQHANASSL
ncbi:MAG: 3-isopropylmalate dehydratase small subunit [Beijerinckiaceae bacterium]|nr:3-isopropylmalate dehydratase small subunit [Beijerinckiaceae bacterium]